jgi:ElaB/YqjD/DUF883 family membrane-anchored ribosome-binding protein
MSNESERAEELRREIDRTRAEMGETLEAIGQRLSPEALKERAKEQLEVVKEKAKEQLELAKERARDEVREQISEVRHHVHDATIGRAQHMMHRTVDRIEDSGRGALDVVRENPIPSALIGIGLGWLLFNMRTQRRGYTQDRSIGIDHGHRYGMVGRDGMHRGYLEERYPYREDEEGYVPRAREAVGELRETAGEMGMRARERVGEVGERVRERVGEVGSQVRERTHELGAEMRDRAHEVREGARELADRGRERVEYLAHEAQFRARRAEDRVMTSFQDNPLALGAVTLALGAAIGAMLPRTERENEMLGAARDHLLEIAKDKGKEMMTRAKDVAGQVQEGATQTVKENLAGAQTG